MVIMRDNAVALKAGLYYIMIKRFCWNLGDYLEGCFKTPVSVPIVNLKLRNSRPRTFWNGLALP